MSHLDGWLYVGMAICASILATLGTDEAKQFISSITLFWWKLSMGASVAGFMAAKMYRSTSFADKQVLDKSETKTETTTQIIQKSEIPPIETKP